MKKLFCLSLVAFFYLNASAQDETLFNRLHGISFTDNVYIQWNGKQFEYMTDNDVNPHALADNSIFNVGNKNNNNFKVYLRFYNPLKYVYKSTQTDIEDPDFKAFNEFGSKLSSAIVPVAAVASSSRSTSTMKVKDDRGNIVTFDASILLNDWIYALSKVIDQKYASDAASGRDKIYESLIRSINNITTVESFLFDKVPDQLSEWNKKEEYTIPQWYQFTSDAIYNTDNNYPLFKKKLAESIEISSHLNAAKATSEDLTNDIIAILTKDFDNRIAPLLANKSQSERENFKRYSTGEALKLKSNTEKLFAADEIILTQLEGLNTKLSTFSDQFKGEPCSAIKNDTCKVGMKREYEFDLSWKATNMKKFEYELTGLNKDGSATKDFTHKITFTVGKRQKSYLFVSTGLLYTWFNYPSYGVSDDNGVNKVAITDQNKVGVRPVVFLNAIFNPFAERIYPFVQLGITTGKNDVLIPVGAGISLGDMFSISGGGMLGYRKELNKLTVGGAVKDDATLQSDLINRGFASWYISLTYNLTKK